MLRILAVDRLADGCQRRLQRAGVPLCACCHFAGQEAVGEHLAHLDLQMPLPFEDGYPLYLEVLRLLQRMAAQGSIGRPPDLVFW